MNKSSRLRTAKNPTSKTDWTDHAKQYYDHCKHMTTLSAGSMLLMVTMYEKLSKAPHFTGLVPLSVTCFLGSLSSALLAMLGFASYSKRRDGTSEDPSNFAIKSFTAAMGFFWLGSVALASFMWKNV